MLLHSSKIQTLRIGKLSVVSTCPTFFHFLLFWGLFLIYKLGCFLFICRSRLEVRQRRHLVKMTKLQSWEAWPVTLRVTDKLAAKLLKNYAWCRDFSTQKKQSVTEKFTVKGKRELLDRLTSTTAKKNKPTENKTWLDKHGGNCLYQKDDFHSTGPSNTANKTGPLTRPTSNRTRGHESVT